MSDWVQVEASLDPLLDRVDPSLQALDSILSFLIGVLNIVQTILNVLKVFLVGFLDPIRAVVELLIEEIRNLIFDLRQLGLYMSGDWELLRSEDRFSNLIGGYQSYERRMIARLQDRSDPSRPDFSSSTVTLGAFFYASSGDINELTRVVNAIIRFFGQKDLAGRSSPYGRPTTPEFRYGTEGASTAAFRQLGNFFSPSNPVTTPDAVSVSWSIPAGTGGFRLFSPAPKGFLIHVSTIPDGLQVIGLTAKDDLSPIIDDLPRVQGAAVDPTTNGPMKLYGGISDIGVPNGDYPAMEKGDARAPVLVLQKDQNTPLIKPSLLGEKAKVVTLRGETLQIPLLADTYFVKTSFLSRTGPGTQYTATFPYELLPQGASFQGGSDGFAEVGGDPFDAQTFYFRIRALTDDYVEKLSENAIFEDASLQNPVSVYNSQVRLYRFSVQLLRKARNGVLLPEPPGNDGDTDLTPHSFTAASSPGIAEFPTTTQITYIEAVQAAIILAILCRVDLTEARTKDGEVVFSQNVYAPGSGLRGLESAGRDLMARYGITPVWFKGTRPQRFHLKLRWLMARISTDLQQRGAPPDSLAQVVLNDARALTSFKWSDLDSHYPDQTILDSIRAPLTERVGVGANPYCRSQDKRTLNGIYRLPNSTLIDFAPARSPSFLTQGASTEENWVPGQGSADFSPVLYADEALVNGEVVPAQRVEYVRNALLTRPQTGEAVLDSAVAVLQVAAAPLSRPIGDTQWIAIRLLPQALAPLDDLLERLDRFLQGILDGLEGIIDKLVTYIEAIQARIYQLQALLEQIRALLRALDFFALPSVNGLVIVESGTDGVTSGLVTAGNKPFDASNTYGAGVAVVAGGLPSVLLELLALILSGGDE